MAGCRGVWWGLLTAQEGGQSGDAFGADGGDLHEGPALGGGDRGDDAVEREVDVGEGVVGVIDQGPHGQLDQLEVGGAAGQQLVVPPGGRRWRCGRLRVGHATRSHRPPGSPRRATIGGFVNSRVALYDFVRIFSAAGPFRR